MSSPGNRIEVMHGVNLDQLGRRDPALCSTGSSAARQLSGIGSAMAATLCPAARPRQRPLSLYPQSA